jgi:nucleoside-diphosphate-sugar epimerase
MTTLAEWRHKIRATGTGGRTVKHVLVTGAGGFVGHHLVNALVAGGYWVRGVDVKYPEYEPTKACEFELLDLRRWANCLQATRGVDEVYNLAANMGGIGFIEAHKAEIMHDNALINIHMLEAARLNGVRRYLYTSSACVYPGYRQRSPDVIPLKEEDAYPADAEDGYGWEKLFAERQCRHYSEDYGLETRIVRFHNIYGPLGTYDGGREKSPAAICRKVALAPDGGTIEIWGDGQQARSYCYIDDCVDGIYRLMRSNYRQPLNLGSDRLVTINVLVDIVANIAGKTIGKSYDVTKPQGVRGRNSDNSRLRQVLRWEPQTSLETGLTATYHWIERQLERTGRLPGRSEERPAEYLSDTLLPASTAAALTTAPRSLRRAGKATQLRRASSRP